MDERFRGRGVWIGLGALALVFLCVMMCGLGAMAMMGMSRGAAHVPPPAVEDGAGPPPAVYGAGSHGWGVHTAHGPFGFLGALVSGFFKLLVFGIILVLGIKLVMRLIFGRRYCRPGPPGKPPNGDAGDWGAPWHAWHQHHWHRRPGSGPPGKAPARESESASAATGRGGDPEQAEAWYDSQQEGEPDQDFAAA